YLAFLYGGIFLSSIWTVFLQFSLPLIIDRDLGVVEALGASIQAVLKNIGGMIVLMILQTLVVLVGVLAICVGVLAALPVALCAFAIAYRMMFPKIQEGESANGPPPPTAYIPSSPY
ncbi:MAG TPA: hypothetical protein VNK26_07360, partial [Pyrinomonadaceae bacterium]|nr:hypothetical protein [Pyrinomonadaceae bacterium]